MLPSSYPSPAHHTANCGRDKWRSKPFTTISMSAILHHTTNITMKSKRISRTPPLVIRPLAIPQVGVNRISSVRASEKRLVSFRHPMIPRHTHTSKHSRHADQILNRQSRFTEVRAGSKRFTRATRLLVFISPLDDALQQPVVRIELASTANAVRSAAVKKSVRSYHAPHPVLSSSGQRLGVECAGGAAALAWMVLES